MIFILISLLQAFQKSKYKINAVQQTFHFTSKPNRKP